MRFIPGFAGDGPAHGRAGNSPRSHRLTRSALRRALVSLVFLGTDSEVATLTARLNELVGSRGEAWHILTAGAFVSMVVPIVVFLSLQRFFVRGLLAGSVKG